MIGAYPEGVWLVDLAPLSGPRLVPSAVGTVLGIEVGSGKPMAGLIAGIRHKRMLLLLDNCEHVIETAAALAEEILRGAAAVHLLATSREPLRVQGESLHHLAPLAMPPPSPRLTAAAALGYAAVQLFVERASAVMEDFALGDAERRWSRKSAASWTGCGWRSNSRRRASRHSASPGSRRWSTITRGS